jgi:hypothetical protein
MYCLTCEYELVNLVGGLCPECGRSFDPTDSSTFDTAPRFTKRLRVYTWVIYGAASVPLLANAVLVFSLLVARGVLGRWPTAWVDDPGSIEFVNGIHYGVALLLLLSLPSGILTLGLLVAGLFHVVIRRLAWTGTIAISLWGAGVILFFWDPAKAWMWFFD